jgi:hypothetical protein
MQLVHGGNGEGVAEGIGDELTEGDGVLDGDLLGAAKAQVQIKRVNKKTIDFMFAGNELI